MYFSIFIIHHVFFYYLHADKMRFAFLVIFFVCSLAAAPPGTPQVKFLHEYEIRDGPPVRICVQQATCNPEMWKPSSQKTSGIASPWAPSGIFWCLDGAGEIFARNGGAAGLRMGTAISSCGDCPVLQQLMSKHFQAPHPRYPRAIVFIPCTPLHCHPWNLAVLWFRLYLICDRFPSTAGQRMACHKETW